MGEEKRLAVFDCDGTLVDSQHSIITCMHNAFEGENLPKPKEEEIRRLVGLPLQDSIKMLQPGIPYSTIGRLKESYSEEWQKLRLSSGIIEPLYPDAIKVLDELAERGWRLGIATGKSLRGLVQTLDVHQVQNRFLTLQTADQSFGKPHPEMLIRAMKDVGANPANTVMIGDTTFDMEMAGNAGVLAIGVNWGYHDCEELKRSGAHTVIQYYLDLPNILDDLKNI